MSKNLVRLGIVGLALSAVACSSDETKSSGTDAGPDGTATGGSGGGSGGKAGSSGKAGSGGSAGSKGGGGGTAGASSDAGTIVLSGIAVDATDGDATKNFDGSKYPALAGVKVCVYGDSSVPCATSESSGKYSIDLPVGLSGYISFEKNGYAPMLYAGTTMAGQNIEAPAMLMTTSAYRDAFGMKGGVDPDPNSGEILFGATTLVASSTPFHESFGATELYYVQGFSVSVSPAAKAGPIFTSDQWEPDPALKVSSAAGWGFLQAAPGDYTLTITHPTMTCGAVTTKVVKGYSTTYVGVLCTPNPTEAGSPGGPSDAATD